MKKLNVKRQGFSLIELLIAAAILGILLALIGAFFASQQRVTSQQVTKATLNNDTRLAMLRMGDIITQASYIYPAGQTINVMGSTNAGATGSISENFTETTGQTALAVLLPRYVADSPQASSPYCNATNAAEGQYCGFLFSIEAAAGYEEILGEDSSSTGLVLVERKVAGLTWEQRKLPNLTWTGTLFKSPLASSVKRDGDPNTEAVTSLGANENLTLSNVVSQFDNGDRLFNTDDKTAVNALINAVEMRLVLQAPIRNETLESERSSTFFTRSVPREALPN